MMLNTENQAVESLDSAAAESRELVREHAVSAALLAFGVGVGVGLVSVSLLSDSTSSRQLAGTEQLGRHLLDALNKVVPSSVLRG